MDDKKSRTKYFYSTSIKAVAERFEFRDELKRIVLWGLDNHPASKQTREYLEYYYGLNGKQKLNFKEIGETYGVTQQAVSSAYWNFINAVEEDFYDFVKSGDCFLKLETLVGDGSIEVSKKQIEDIIIKTDRLSLIEKQALTDYLGLFGAIPITNAQIKQKIGLTEDIDFLRLKAKLARAWLKDQKIEQSGKPSLDFIQKYKGMDEEQKAQLKKAIEWYLQSYAIDEQSRKYINEFFGLGEQPLGSTQIAEKHDKALSTVSTVINRFIKKVQEAYVNFEKNGETVFSKELDGHIISVTKGELEEFVKNTSKLNIVERELIAYRFGLFGVLPLTIEQAARVIGHEVCKYDSMEIKVFRAINKMRKLTEVKV